MNCHHCSVWKMTCLSYSLRFLLRSISICVHTAWWTLQSQELNHLQTTFDSSPISWRPSLSMGRELACQANSHFPCCCWFILDYGWRRRCKDRAKNSAMKESFRWRTNQVIHQEACFTTKPINPLVVCILNRRCVWKGFRHKRMNAMELEWLIPDTLNTATITEKNPQNTQIKNHNKLKIRNDAMKPCKAKRTEESFV
jgi:hypothetical protein